IIAEVEVDTPEVVVQHELELKVPSRADGRGNAEVAAGSEWACKVRGKRPVGHVDRRTCRLDVGELRLLISEDSRNESIFSSSGGDRVIGTRWPESCVAVARQCTSGPKCV